MDIQNQTFYTGVVENRNDPLFLGRCQVRVVGLHTEDKNELPTNMLPWAYPMGPITSASMNGIGHSPLGPVEGSWVMVVFRDVEKQQPIMIGTVGGIPQQDNNAEIERDDDNYLLNVDDGEVYLTASGVPIRVTSDGVMVGGETGSALEGRAYLAQAVNEIQAELGGGPNKNVLNLSRVGVAGAALASMSSYSSPDGTRVGQANNNQFSRSQYDLNQTLRLIEQGISIDGKQLTPEQRALIQNQYNQYQAVGALTGGKPPPATVGQQIAAVTTGYTTISNAAEDAYGQVTESAQNLGQSFRNASQVFGNFQNLPVLNISGLPGFDNLQFYRGNGAELDGIELGGITGGLTKVSNQINQGIQKINEEVTRVGNQVGKVTDKVTNAISLASIQLRDSNIYGQIINDKFFDTSARYGTTLGSEQTSLLRAQDEGLVSTGLTPNQKFVTGVVANVLITQALKNPKIAAVANALITTKKAFDTINNVIGRYTRGPINQLYYNPQTNTNITRAVSVSNLLTGISPFEVRPTDITAAAAARAAEIAEKAGTIATTINDIADRIENFSASVARVQLDIGQVIGAVASTAGAWTHVGIAFGKQKKGSKSNTVVMSSGKLEVQFNRYDIITIVGLMQINELSKFRDSIGLYRTLSIPESPINFNVNGVVGGQNYGVVSPIGELGKYQVNAEQLAQLGYVKYLTNVKGERVFPSNFRLASNDTWTGKSGITSIQKFITTPAVQEKMMNELIAYNYDQLILDGIITENTTVQEIGGLLSIAHNTGIFAVRQFVNGENVSNSRGQSAYDAYQLGHTAIAGSDAATTPGLQPAENPDPNQPAIGEVGSDGKPSLGRPTDKTETIGFRDPNRKYPLRNQLNEPDTNRLSRNQFIRGTVVDLKDARRDRKVVVGGVGATWDEPPSPYDALYPYNHVYQSESGHLVEYDDTPNRERMHWYHRSGTFMEWDPNGTSVRKIVGDGYEIFERNGFIHVKGECNLTVEGNCNVMVKSNATIEVLGTTQGYFRNDFNAEVSGNMNLSVKESFQLKARDIHFETTGTPLLGIGIADDLKVIKDGFMRMKINGPYIGSAEGDWNVTARNSLYQQAGDRASLTSGNSMYLYTNDNINLFSSAGSINAFAAVNITNQSLGTMFLSTGGKLDILSAGILAMTGVVSANLTAAGPLNLRSPTLVNLNSPVAVPAVTPPPTPGLPSFVANPPFTPIDSRNPAFAVLPAVPILPSRNPLNPSDLILALALPSPSSRGTPINPRYDIFSLPPRGASGSQIYESPDEGSEVEFVERQSKRGKINQNEPATAQEETTVAQNPRQAAKKPACASFANVQDFPLSTKLSPNFYLGDFIPGGGGKYICLASTPQRLRDVPGGWTKQEIVCNLKGFAENIMEKVITVVPKQDIVVTSGWRFPGSIGANESPTSDHGSGAAVDIILRSYGNDRRKHYELIQKLQNILPFDQLLLEYENGKKGSLVWIHIGHRSWQSTQRGQAFTVNNHSTYKRNGFALLT